MTDVTRIAEMAEHRRAQAREEAEAAHLLRAAGPVTPVGSSPARAALGRLGLATDRVTCLGLLRRFVRAELAR